MNWDSFAYQHLVGGLVFLAGILAAWFQGDYTLKSREGRGILFFLFFIFGVYFLGRLLWQFYGLGML